MNCGERSLCIGQAEFAPDQICQAQFWEVGASSAVNFSTWQHLGSVDGRACEAMEYFLRMPDKIWIGFRRDCHRTDKIFHIRLRIDEQVCRSGFGRFRHQKNEHQRTGNSHIIHALYEGSLMTIYRPITPPHRPVPGRLFFRGLDFPGRPKK